MTCLQLPKTATALLLTLAGALAVATPAAANPFTGGLSPTGYSLAAAEGAAGKCGGGKGPDGKGCAMMRMDADGDGRVSREEFIQGHADMFDKMDSNGDGMLDAAEQRAHKAMRKQNMGKCGQ